MNKCFIIPLSDTLSTYAEYKRTLNPRTDSEALFVDNFDPVEYSRVLVSEMLNSELDASLRSIGRKVEYQMDIYISKLQNIHCYSDGLVYIDPDEIAAMYLKLSDTDVFSKLLELTSEHLEVTNGWDAWQVTSTPVLLMIENLGDQRVLEWNQENVHHHTCPATDIT